jgi:hypothetical protein
MDDTGCRTEQRRAAPRCAAWIVGLGIWAVVEGSSAVSARSAPAFENSATREALAASLVQLSAPDLRAIELRLGRLVKLIRRVTSVIRVKQVRAATTVPRVLPAPKVTRPK